jgi:hypothetical protein
MVPLCVKSGQGVFNGIVDIPPYKNCLFIKKRNIKFILLIIKSYYIQNIHKMIWCRKYIKASKYQFKANLNFIQFYFNLFHYLIYFHY